MYRPWTRPLTRRQLVLWVSFYLGIGLALSAAVALLPKGYAVTILALTLGWLVWDASHTSLRPRRCLICDGLPTIMLPKRLDPLPWWQLTPRTEDVVWVCEEHVTTWIKLVPPPERSRRSS